MFDYLITFLAQKWGNSVEKNFQQLVVLSMSHSVSTPDGSCSRSCAYKSIYIDSKNIPDPSPKKYMVQYEIPRTEVITFFLMKKKEKT